VPLDVGPKLIVKFRAKASAMVASIAARPTQRLLERFRRPPLKQLSGILMHFHFSHPHKSFSLLNVTMQALDVGALTPSLLPICRRLAISIGSITSRQ
jgi:hypothetical protein